MRKTAIILAGAAIFDLGVVVVSVPAQEVFRPSSGTVVTAPGTTSNRDHIDQDAQLRGCANGKHLPEAQLSACRDTSVDPSGPAGQTRAVDLIFIKIDAVNSVQACTARRGEVVTHEGIQQCRLPASAGSSNLRGAPGTGMGTSPGRAATLETLALNFTKIDIHYTARACIAQRGEVVMREGVQQCALPTDPGNSPVRPNRR